MYLSVPLALWHCKNSKWNPLRLCSAASTDIRTVSKQYMPPTQPGSFTFITAIVGGDGGSSLENKSRKITKNVPVSCHGGCLHTMDWVKLDNHEDKKLLLKKEQNCTHCLNLPLLYVLEHLSDIHPRCAVRRCFGAVLNRVNAEHSEHNAGSMHTQVPWELKSMLLYLGADFPTIWAKNLLSSQLLFIKYVYYFAEVFKNF